MSSKPACPFAYTAGSPFTFSPVDLSSLKIKISPFRSVTSILPSASQVIPHGFCNPVWSVSTFMTSFSVWVVKLYSISGVIGDSSFGVQDFPVIEIPKISKADK